MFTDRIFVLNQSDNMIVSVFMSLTASRNVGPVLYKVVSSANNIHSLLLMFSCKSFKIIKKRLSVLSNYLEEFLLTYQNNQIRGLWIQAEFYILFSYSINN